MKRKPDPELQRLMCELTDANEAVHRQLSKVFRAVNRLAKLRKRALRVAKKIGRHQDAGNGPQASGPAGGKAGGQ